MNKISYIVFVIIFLAGCSSRTVNFDYDQEADFTAFTTYDWYESDQMVADEAPLAHQRVIAAIDRQMAAKGFQEASSDPDVYVTYYASDRENTVIDTTHYGYGYGSGWRWGGMGGMGMSTSTSTVRNYTTGTLVVDLWDANAKRLVWRGTASDTVSDVPSKNAKTIDGVVVDMFKRYPPRSQ